MEVAFAEQKEALASYYTDSLDSCLNRIGITNFENKKEYKNQAQQKLKRMAVERAKKIINF